ncbi:hypothetical protein [Lysobacter sp. 1R34A]|uniref:hypothetical protein n=1 Tax=Lysobacter sp. 1R34A TaxID=3445786 RepID=UPI003EEE6F5A
MFKSTTITRFNRARVSMLTALTLAILPGLAMAQTTAPDTTETVNLFKTYGPAAVVLIIAFSAVLWSIRAAGLFKPR